MALRKTPWTMPHRLEHNYFRALLNITEQLSDMISGQSDPARIIALLENVFHWPQFQRYADLTASNFVTHLMAENARSWREAAREGGKGRLMYAALMKELQGPVGGVVSDLIQQNAKLIRTLPLDISERVTQYIGEETRKGRRAAGIAEEIQKMFPEASRAKASLIARTEVSKSHTALTRARSEDVGITSYEWLTSEDQRVRSSHAHMRNVIVFWDDPPQPEKLLPEDKQPKTIPAPYHAGNIWNCRCIAAIYVDPKILHWPHKVFRNKEIHTMTLSQFQQLSA